MFEEVGKFGFKETMDLKDQPCLSCFLRKVRKVPLILSRVFFGLGVWAANSPQLPKYGKTSVETITEFVGCMVGANCYPQPIAHLLVLSQKKWPSFCYRDQNQLDTLHSPALTRSLPMEKMGGEGETKGFPSIFLGFSSSFCGLLFCC